MLHGVTERTGLAPLVVFIVGGALLLCVCVVVVFICCAVRHRRALRRLARRDGAGLALVKFDAIDNDDDGDGGANGATSMKAFSARPDT